MKYDVAIVGGGLAGLSQSILLSKKGYSVVLFEKESYPFHRVCGEYISMESWNFINHLGLDLNLMALPQIKKLIVTSPNGNRINADLPLGGFGISRHLIDHRLSQIAKSNGVMLYESVKVEDVIFKGDGFEIITTGEVVNSTIACGCFGKRSNLDVKWLRKFTRNKPGKLNNWIGVKYHIKTDHPEDTIALHNFKYGYCGISKVEDDKYCLCYLTSAANLAQSNNSITRMEQDILARNPYLTRLFTTSSFLFNKPEIISQISFDKKSPVENHVLMAGDSAGMITPLCGNGMSMAMHSSKIAVEVIDKFLQKNISREVMEAEYTSRWQRQFHGRLRAGRIIQSFFGKEWLTNAFIFALKPFPGLIRRMIQQTHGKEY